MRNFFYPLFLLVALCLMQGCSGHGSSLPMPVDSTLVLPSMETHDVSMLVSDSGVIKYHITSPVWLRYTENVNEDYQYFPEGICLHQIDTAMNALGTILADTAYNYERRQIWHLISNVRITTVQQEKFFTNDLYWNMRDHKIYSDSFIRIERRDMILEGYGFESNDNFTRYQIRQSSGVFHVDEGKK